MARIVSKIVILTVALWATAAWAEDARQITVTGQASIATEPDLATLTLGVTHTDRNARAAMADGKISGNIPILDTHYGNVWTNVSSDMFESLGVAVGDEVWVKITSGDKTLYEEKVRYVSSFGGVAIGEPCLYVNDILNMGLAINQDDFAKVHGIVAGPEQNIEFWK